MSAAADPKTTPAPSEERPPSASPVDAHSSPVAETRQSSGKATAALVLGVIGVLGAFLIPIVGLILGVIAIVFGSQAKGDTAGGRKSGRGQAQAGFVLGIVAVVGSIINMIVTAAIIAS